MFREELSQRIMNVTTNERLLSMPSKPYSKSTTSRCSKLSGG